MAFIAGIRQSERNPGTIETGLGFGGTNGKGGIKEYLTNWDRSDSAAFTRRCACFLAFGLHVPMNIISIMGSRGLDVILGTIFSVLNIICVALALWKLDVMRGSRLFYNKIYNRRHFDYAILILLVVYAVFFAMLVVGKVANRHFIYYIRVIWPMLVITDFFGFLVGWITTWQDYSGEVAVNYKSRGPVNSGWEDDGMEIEVKALWDGDS